MKKNYSGALLMCALFNLSAQEVLWEKNIKSNTQDFLSQVTTTIDGQYLISGSSIHPSTSSGTTASTGSATGTQNMGYDYHLVKLNQQGEKIWEKYFSAQNHDFLSATVATEEGNFILAGTTYSGKSLDKKDDSKGGSDIWLIKVNSFGDEIWQKTIGTNADEEARSVIQTTDLGFLVAGSVQNSAKGYGTKDALIVKLDKDGKELSQVILGGRSIDEVEKMIPTKDGGALLGIYSRSGSGGSKKTENFGEGDYYIIKLDRNCRVEWEKNYGGTGDDHLRTLALTSSGYVIGGESRSKISGNKTVGIEAGTDLWFVALDEKGNEEWQKSYNFGNRDVLMGMSVLHSADDKTSTGILIGGYTQAEGRIQTDDEKFWILYVDENGHEKWRKYVQGQSHKKEERLSDIKLNRDGSIILAGTSAETLGSENWKIIKLGDKQIDQLIVKQDIKIYPNPVSDYAYVEIGFTGLREGAFEAEILVYDMSGRQLQSLKTRNKVTKINTQSLIQGAYLVTVKTDTNKTASAKLIKK
ncbi:T9SS type A sorting domain-containing protein [Chryseobacterium limigenitum]|uniref:Por secretion system C-terminal sorting domain-containing protein n=1 Tax=Chryseobacterium limigenitum TaxID=1612149 RepID=A0A1K2IST6_9FLAO|nr:T9SS type A sorting domain-containing protein [Chryseobacterium limigenitum]SFZ95489.1 Por secretion system C-terminal sorting domain-containing protein [Chryseobacterium limigenitum]